jgi:hypothetical protein
MSNTQPRVSSPRIAPRSWCTTLVALFMIAAAACSGSSSAKASASPAAGHRGNQGTPTAAQLIEASRLVNIGALPKVPPASVVACVARVVVQNPSLDQIANDIAQIQNGDLRQAVMYSYLQCGYSYIVDSYMRFAPAGLSTSELACIRSKFTQLNVNSLAEVIVLDPDAGFTGPLVIQACKSGSKSNPLLKNGSLISMGGS